MGGVYLLLSLPLSALARRVEARLKSTTLAARRDPVAIALLVLAVTAVIGWLCGVLVEGFSPGHLLESLGQLVAGVELSVGAMLFIFLTLGLVVYLLGGLVGLVRRGGGLPSAPVEREEAIAPALLSK